METDRRDEPSSLAPDAAPRRPLVTAAERQRILFAVLVTVLALPLLLLHHVPRAQASASAVDAPQVQVRLVSGSTSHRKTSHPGPVTTSSTEPTSTTSRPATTTTRPPATTTTRPASTTTAAPTTTTEPPSTTTAAPTTTTMTAPPTTTTRPPQTTTTAPRPAPTTTTAPKAPAHSRTGQATYYSWKPGNCANNQLPFGTVVTVTNLANGRSTTCVVGDRGAFGPPTIIDLDKTVFARIADPSAGRIPVRISW